jgi:hypothetical protein
MTANLVCDEPAEVLGRARKQDAAATDVLLLEIVMGDHAHARCWFPRMYGGPLETSL